MPAEEQDIAGRVALITGANTGIGFETARELAMRRAHVFIACRSPARAEAAMEALRARVPGGRFELLELDLSDFDSVRRCAQEFDQRGLALSLLINNGGISGARGLTRSGFELAFGINHVGHFLLTQLLLPRLREAGAARIVTVSSNGHRAARRIDFSAVRAKTKTITGYAEYCVSKLANVLFSNELARRLEGTGITTYSLHPGVVASNIWREVPWPIRPLIKLAMISPEEGAATTLHCALSREAAAESGQYYQAARLARPSRASQDRELAAELWERTEAWVNS
jgi:NAD(P)-dependent dehydrogenase (short-subunit alcohol dehydrogenase family)